MKKQKNFKFCEVRHANQDSSISSINLIPEIRRKCCEKLEIRNFGLFSSVKFAGKLEKNIVDLCTYRASGAIVKERTRRRLAPSFCVKVVCLLS